MSQTVRLSRIIRDYAFFVFTISLALGLTACQTPEHKQAKDSKTQKIHDSQFDLVHQTLEQGNPERAILMTRQLLAKRPKDADLYNLRGLAQLSLKQAFPALKSFRMAVKLDPEQPHYQLNLAAAHIEAGDYDKATGILLALMKSEEATKYLRKERVYHNLGYAYDKKGRDPLAERWYRRAIEENPTHFLSHLGLAKIYERTGRPALARASFTQVTDYCGTCYQPIEPLVRLYLQANQPQLASKVLLRFIKTKGITPRHRQQAERMLGMISRDPGSTVGQLDKASRSNPRP